MSDLKALGDWTDKGMGLAELLDAAGVEIVRIEDALYSNDPDQAQKINAGYTAEPDPVYVSAYEWFSRVTPQRLGEIRKALMAPGLEMLLGLYDHVLANGRINVSGPEAAQGVGALLQAAVITQDEHDALLRP